MKNITLIIALSFLSVASFAKKDKKSKKTSTKEQEIELLSQDDTLSYAFGIYIGTQGFPKEIESKIDYSILFKAIKEAKDTSSVLLKQEDAQKFLNSFFQNIQEEKLSGAKEEGAKFLADNKTKEGVKVTASGLQYKVIKEGAGEKPSATDKVTVHYTGTLINGTKFDSSVDRGEPATFPLNQVIPGWTEGVQLMSKGAKYRFFIPYELGYGERGAGQSIPPYSTLIFDVELLEINK